MHAGQWISGRYRLEEPIGSGGMGIVWRALDEECGTPVAVKRARTGACDLTDRRIAREARIAAKLQHPHVVALLDDVTEGEDHWLVMEYVPAQSLATILADRGRLPAGEVAAIGAQIASALEAVHANGVVHRDVKPGNVLVGPDGLAKLADFGIARAGWADVTATDSGLVGGTPAYLAPEVANGDEPAPASDLFSLGATLFAAVEGAPPFGSEENPLLILRRAAAGRVPAATRAGALAPVLSALLEVDPARRPDAARARQLLAEHAEPSRLGRVDGLGRSRRRTRCAVVGAGTAAALVAALLLGTHFALRPTPPGTHPSTAASVGTIGEPRSADPCGLVRTGPLARFGSTNLDSHYGNFDRCDVIVTSPGRGSIDVTVALDEMRSARVTPSELTRTSGSLRFASGPEDDRECDRALLLPAGGIVFVSAKQIDGHSDRLCAMADTATTTAAGVLHRGPVPRRTAAPAVNSLARLDACRLLDQQALTAVPGLREGDRERGFAGWDCRWESGRTDVSVQLRFDQRPPLTAGEDGTRRRLAGRDAFVLPDGQGPHTCLVRVGYRSFVDERNGPKTEFLYLVVAGQRSQSELCATATTLAGAATRKVPRS